MFKYVMGPGVLQYEGETREQALERDRLMREHNEAVDRELEKWGPAPARFYTKWIKKHAPHLLKKGAKL